MWQSRAKIDVKNDWQSGANIGATELQSGVNINAMEWHIGTNIGSTEWQSDVNINLKNEFQNIDVDNTLSHRC